MTEPRLDQENLNALLEHLKYVNYGKTIVEFIVHNGWIVGWEERETRRGHKAPLCKRLQKKIK